MEWSDQDDSGRPDGRRSGTGRRGRSARRCAAAELTAEEVGALVDEYHRSGDRRLRNQVVEAHLWVAEHQVRAVRHAAGASVEDLRQTALLAMIRAVDRFDPSRGVTFRTFAARTIEGELKRFLRDRSWAVRPPRRAQELNLIVRRRTDELAQSRGRSPTVGEVSASLDVPVDDVLAALEAGRARSAVGLSAPARDAVGRRPILERIGAPDPALASVDDRCLVQSAVDGLDLRERQVLQLRFVDDLSQPEIAEVVGVSQSYVSRLLRSGLDRMREQLVS